LITAVLSILAGFNKEYRKQQRCSSSRHSSFR